MSPTLARLQRTLREELTSTQAALRVEGLPQEERKLARYCARFCRSELRALARRIAAERRWEVICSR